MSFDTWRLRWSEHRNRLLASARFQQVATRMPGMRGIARRRARALFDLVAGFTYSQTLAACVASGLLDLLVARSATSDEVAAHTALPTDGALRLLKAAAALDLVESVGDRWTLGQAGAALAGNPGIAAMVVHHDALYADLADPLALLRRGGGGGALSRYWHYAESPGAGDAAAVTPYSALMAASQPMIAAQALAAYDFRRHRRLLDVGGGEGAFLTAIGGTAPALHLGLFDLPAVTARAAQCLAAAGLGGRSTMHAGDFIHDPLPSGYDLVTLVRILHDHDDVPALALLRSIHAALPPGGKLLIVEPMAGTRGALPAGDAYFGLYLLAMGSGRPRTAREIKAMLQQAGFGSARELKTPLPLTARALIASR